jgi:hypothetical protein
MRTRYPTFALIRVARLEMTPVAVLSASRIPGAALMPFIVDDEFHVFAREHRLPPCALSFLMLAGPWSARESRSGFVPNSMLADFSDDFAQAEGTLCSAGILKRVKAGVRIVEGHGLTVVNAKDVSRDTERERAEAEERREAWRLKKQGQRASKRAAKHERIAAGVPGVSPEETVDVPRENPGHPKKPQVKAGYVPGDIVGTSRGTETPSRARADFDPDFDFNQREENQVSQSGVSDAGAREDDPPPGSPEFRLLVVAEFAGVTGIEIDDATADALAAGVLGKATDPVPHPFGYVRRAIHKELNPRARWLPKQVARTAFAKPLDHCGDRLCSPKTRRREHPETGADAGPCPKCSGSAATWKAS